MAWEFGLISPLYSLLKDVLGWVFKKCKKTDPAEIVLARQRRKEEFESKLRWIDDVEGYGEAIIRDIKRVDSYPDIDEKAKGISPWFRVGILGLYHRGLQVGLRIEAIKFDEELGGWRKTSDYANEQTINAYVVGRIPFESIKSVDWEGDEYYGYTHIYCQFNRRRGEPYESVTFCEKKQNPGGRPFYTELAGYEELRQNDKRHEKLCKNKSV